MKWQAALCGVILALARSGSAVPDTCRTTFDAVARVRGELFFFKDHHFWRLNRHDRLQTRRPVPLESFWKGLPKAGRISAAYERPDGTVVFFSGRYFWVVWDRHAMPGYPRPLTELGLPEETMEVDAAFISGHNKATYLVTGDHYWRFNELTGEVEKDSPLPLNRLCRGLPGRLDAAFRSHHGATYFIQGQHYWTCDLEHATVQSYAPDLVAPRWFGCSLVQCCLQEINKETETRVERVMDDVHGEWRRGVSERKTAGRGSGAQAGVAMSSRKLALQFALMVIVIFA